MKFFLDTEFIEDGKTIDLVSIAIVAEDGRTYYAQNIDAQLHRASDWVKKNVIPYLTRMDVYEENRSRWNPFWTDSARKQITEWRTRKEIADEVRIFVGWDPEFWGYYADYDWVVLCQLFGTMMDLPADWPKFCRDLKQLAGKENLRVIPQVREHHALDDAAWIKEAYEYIVNRPRDQNWSSIQS